MPPLGLEYDHSPPSSAEVNGQVGILTSLRAERSRNSGSMLGRDKKFFSSPHDLRILGFDPVSCLVDNGDFIER